MVSLGTWRLCLKKRLVSVLIRAVDPTTLPEALGKIELLPAVGVFTIEQHLPTLIETLNTDRAWLKEANMNSRSCPAMAQQASRPWSSSARDRALGCGELEQSANKSQVITAE